MLSKLFPFTLSCILHGPPAGQPELWGHCITLMLIACLWCIHEHVTTTKHQITQNQRAVEDGPHDSADIRYVLLSRSTTRAKAARISQTCAFDATESNLKDLDSQEVKAWEDQQKHDWTQRADLKDEGQVQETRTHTSKEEPLEKIQNPNVQKDEPIPLKKGLRGRMQHMEEVRRSLVVLSEGFESKVKQLERENADERWTLRKENPKTAVKRGNSEPQAAGQWSKAPISGRGDEWTVEQTIASKQMVRKCVAYQEKVHKMED